MATVDLELIRGIPIFADLEPHLLQLLAAGGRTRTYGPGKTVLFEGDPGVTVFVVLSGTVSIQRCTARGDVLYVARRGPGDLLGEMALLDGEVRMADVVTESQCELLQIDGASFRRCLEQSPALSQKVLHGMAERIREEANRRERAVFQDVLGRVAAALLEYARLHGTEPEPEGLRLREPINQTLLAQEIHSERETANKALHRLERAGVILVKSRRVTILDLEKLRQYAER